jgi:hypothetical protein
MTKEENEKALEDSIFNDIGGTIQVLRDDGTDE